MLRSSNCTTFFFRVGVRIFDMFVSLELNEIYSKYQHTLNEEIVCNRYFRGMAILMQVLFCKVSVECVSGQWVCVCSVQRATCSERRSSSHLHADDSRSHGCNVGLCSNRRHTFSGFWGVCLQGTGYSHRPCKTKSDSISFVRRGANQEGRL